MQGTYYDGQSAEGRQVDLSLDGDMLVLGGADGFERRDPIDSVDVTDPLGSTKRWLRFHDAAACEVEDGPDLHALFGPRVRGSAVSRWERGWRPAGIAMLLVLVVGVVTYVFVLPVMARSAADRLPASALDTLSDEMRPVLDRTVFEPTKLSQDRTTAIMASVYRLDFDMALKERIRLEFRHADSLGANAMALPSGAIFVTDQLVALTPDDEVIAAVIAHEIGHVSHRHGLRQIIQSTAVGVFVTWFIGDLSALGAAAPSALLEAKYSRDLEREADAYAVAVLRASGIDPGRLAQALELIEKSHGAAGDGGVLAYMSTHPTTEERKAWLRAQ
jgi:Zn-dependent protease with chaperone function